MDRRGKKQSILSGILARVKNDDVVCNGRVRLFCVAINAMLRCLRAPGPPLTTGILHRSSTCGTIGSPAEGRVRLQVTDAPAQRQLKSGSKHSSTFP
jgi:hypothetical protein